MVHLLRRPPRLQSTQHQLHRATAESSVLNGIVTSITVTDGGFGYSQTNVPSVMVQSDTYKFENIRSIKER